MRKTVNAAGATESWDYLNGFSIKHTNTRGYSTITRYRALGEPAYTLPTVIVQPEQVTTNIHYDLFENITAIEQGGMIEKRIYNSSQFLCLVSRPETGVSVFEYNSIGQVQKYSHGLSGAATSCSDYHANTNNQMLNSYDHLGTLMQVNYGDGTASVNYQYDQQGNLLSLSNGMTQWSYSYNTAHLLEKEILTVDNLSWILDPSYNSLGHLHSITYPSGKSIQYAPNALAKKGSELISSVKKGSELISLPPLRLWSAWTAFA